MAACKSTTFAFQYVKPFLRTITHLMQYTVLEIQFWSVKLCLTTVTVAYTKISSISIPSHQVMQATTYNNGIGRPDENKSLQNEYRLFFC